MPRPSDLLILMALLSLAALTVALYIAGVWPFDPMSGYPLSLVPALGSPADRAYFGPDEGIYPPGVLACSHHDPADTRHDLSYGRRRSDSGRLDDAGLPNAFAEHDPEMDRPYIPGIQTAPDNHMLAHGGLATANALHDGAAHSHDYHVSVTYAGDGMCRSTIVNEYVVPCGVCEDGGSDVFPALTAKFGAEVHSDIREQIRLHLERATRLLYPDATSVTVR